MFVPPNALLNRVEQAGQGKALFETRTSRSRLVPFEHFLRRTTTLLRLATALSAWLALSLTDAHAHEHWNNGEQVPAWVKTACCGPNDVHHLRPEQIRRNAAGDYVVDIYPWAIPAHMALPSQDGDYWLFFYEDFGVYGRIRCFFAPALF
jgi:hypothetical protein